MKKSFVTTGICLLSLFACRQNLVETPALPDYATVTLKNVNSDKFLEVGGNPALNEKFKDNALLQQWQTSMSGAEMDRWQKWHLIYQTTTNGISYYHIRNLHSGKLIDVPAGANASGTVLQQYAAFPLLADQQLWRLVDLGGGQYKIVNKGNGLALSVEGGSTGNGAKVIQETPASNNRQYWTISVIANDTYRDDEIVRFYNRNNPAQGSAAFDLGNSIPLTWGANNGKVLWVTQDAWDGSQLQPNNMFNCGDFHRYSNSVLIQPSKTDWNPNNAPSMTISNSSSVNHGRSSIYNRAPPGPGQARVSRSAIRYMYIVARATASMPRASRSTV